MQLGFLSSAKQNASFLYTALEGDILLVAKGYFAMDWSFDFSGYRISQARNLPGVASATGIMIRHTRWANTENGKQLKCMVLEHLTIEMPL
ncbi:MAG: hypothetical protein GKR87_01850 [Kiritimatiellae bacterium]|nr:hypothetical protein [Kiritimatiellia bacterium]